MGRVFSQPAEPAEGGGPPSLLREMGRRLLRSGVADVEVVARWYDTSARAVTDEDGFYHFHLTLDAEPPGDRLWHPVEIEIASPPDQESVARGRATGEVYIPPSTARRVVISDIDDTVMFTGVADRIRMFWRLFAQDARSRVAFPGVSPFYRALFDGQTDDERNPILYVSRGPWGIYEMLDEFFDVHDIPVGPILFLREWGVRPTSPFPRKSEEHKRETIRRMLELYDGLPFVLIGDSGQHDPEIYAELVDEHPRRVEAVYIRDVSDSESRAAEVRKLAEEVSEAGSALVLAADSYRMARHASDLGLIAEERLAEVAEAQAREGS